MRPVYLALATIAVFAVTLGTGSAQSDLPQILELSRKSAGKLRYSGIRKVQMKLGPDTVQHTEYILRDGMRTRIWFPDEGSFRGQIIVETEKERRHFFPDRNQIEVMPPRRPEHFTRIGKPGRDGKPRATFRVFDGDTIAGRETRRVDAVGSNGAVFMKMWIDSKTGLTLKRVVYGKHGPQATFEFTSVDYKPQLKKSDFELTIRGARVMTPRDRLDDLIKRGGFQSVVLSPKDPYKLESARIQRIENVSALVQVYVKNDGRVSLYQVKAPIDPNRLRRSSRGERVGTYSWQKNGTSFVLIGDLTDNKLREIAQRLGG